MGSCRNAPGAERYIVCNADEGEPGTFKDRVLLTSYADRVFEGMAIAGFAVGAARGLLYLRGEYRYLLEPLRGEARARCARDRPLGASICGAQGFDFDIEIHLGRRRLYLRRGIGADRIAGGQAGQAAQPSAVPGDGRLSRQADGGQQRRDARPGDRGRAPRRRAFAGRGTKHSTGTKILSVSGDCARPGLYEYPFGVRVAQVLQDCGAGDVAAVQISGPSGVCLTPDEFRRHIAFEDVPTAGAFMVFGTERDMFEVARNFAHFFAHESCGFCTPCRVGTALHARRAWTRSPRGAARATRSTN